MILSIMLINCLEQIKKRFYDTEKSKSFFDIIS